MTFDEQKKLWELYIEKEAEYIKFRFDIDELIEKKSRMSKELEDIRQQLTGVAVGVLTEESTHDVEKKISVDPVRKVKLKSGTQMLEILRYVKEHGGISRYDLTEVFGRKSSGTISSLILRKYIRQTNGQIFFKSWKGLSNSEYMRIKKTAPNRNDMYERIRKIISESNMFLSATEIHKLLRINMSVSYVRERLREMERDNVLVCINKRWGFCQEN